jgi:hypothetical protein
VSLPHHHIIDRDGGVQQPHTCTRRRRRGGRLDRDRARRALITEAARLDDLSFGYLVSLIPAEFYVPPDGAAAISRKASKYHKHTKHDRATLDKEAKKIQSRERKRAKYEKASNPSTADMMKERAASKGSRGGAPQPVPLAMLQRPQVPAAAAAGADGMQIANANANAPIAATHGKVTSIDTLRAKLQQRIALLRGGRGGDATKRVRVPKGKKKGAKAKAKAKAKATAAAAAAGGKPAADAAAVAAAASSSAAASVNTAAERVLDETARRAAKADMRLAFGNIQFADGDTAGDGGVRKGKKGAKKKGKKPLPQLLKEAQAKKERLEELKRTPEGQKLVTEGAWDKLMVKAAGKKVRDDPKLLKRAMKRKASSKRKSAEAWAERKEKVQQASDRKQERRHNNIEKKRDKKRNFTRPGFEGGALLG